MILSSIYVQDQNDPPGVKDEEVNKSKELEEAMELEEEEEEYEIEEQIEYLDETEEEKDITFGKEGNVLKEKKESLQKNEDSFKSLKVGNETANTTNSIVSKTTLTTLTSDLNRVEDNSSDQKHLLNSEKSIQKEEEELSDEVDEVDEEDKEEQDEECEDNEEELDEDEELDGEDLSEEFDDSELMTRLDAKYGKLPARDYESDEESEDSSWTRN